MNGTEALNKETLIYQYVIKQERPEMLLFWGHTEEPGKVTKACLSQWYPCKFRWGDEQFSSAEQFMMARKALAFDDTETYNAIMKETSPATCKKLGRKVKGFKHTVWDAIKETIVELGNGLKFAQNPALLDFLLSTSDKVLVEASPTDTIWGIGLRQDDPAARNPQLWKGENLLGFALMRVRKDLS